MHYIGSSSILSAKTGALADWRGALYVLKKILKIARTAVFISAAIFILVAAASYNIIHKIGKAQVDSSKEYLEEVAVQYRNSFVNRINGDLQTLRMLAAVLTGEGCPAKEIVDRIQKKGIEDPYIRMSFVEPGGKAYIVDRKGNAYQDMDMSNLEFIQKALRGEDAVSEVIMDYNGEGYVNGYAVPIYKDGQVVGAVTSTIQSEVFRDIISTDIFGGKGIAHIINSRGDIVFRSTGSLTGMDIENVWEDERVTVASRDVIAQNIEKRKNGIYEVAAGDVSAWGAYVYTGINDWYVLTLVPMEVLSVSFNHLTRVAGASLGLIVFSALALITTVILTNYRSQKSITSLAYFDQLTGLYNKTGFLLDAREKLEVSHEYALVLLDIADFRFYNELFGFEEGDRLLKEMAEILKEDIQPGECCCRDKGDCFGALIHTGSAGNLEELKRRLYKICDRISAIALQEDKRFKITCSCGVKIVEMYSRSIDLDLFFDRAAMALKRAKGTHKNQIFFYNDEIHAKARMRNMIENRMHPALENREFQVYVQPKVKFLDGTLSGGEALIRWPIENGNMIYPGEFIPVFEKNGFIAQVDLYMLESVCRMLRKWMDEGYEVKPISVNQSKVLFYQKNYIEKVIGITEKYRIPPSLIILEVTESLIMENAEDINVILKRLERRGFRVSLDDFGAGYSSLNTLKDLSIDELKIDRVFLSETEEEEKSRAVLGCMFELAKSLSIHTVVEGVETKEQLETIRELGGEVIQGYYFDPPMPAEAYRDKYLKLCKSL